MTIYPITLLVLGAMLSVLAYHNWRTGVVTNAANAAIFIGSLIAIIIKAQLAAPPDDRLFPLSWGLIGLGLLIMFKLRFGLGGGTTKLLIAIVPWMQPTHYLWMIAVFGAAQTLLERSMRRHGQLGDLPAVPAIALGALAVAFGTAFLR